MANRFHTAALLAALTPMTVLAENLLDIYHSAKNQDMQVESARLGLAAQSEQRNQARAAILPSLSTDAGLNYGQSETQSQTSTTTIDNNTTQSVGLSLKQGLYHRDVIKQAESVEELIKLAELQYSQSEQTLILRVAQSYFTVLAAHDSLELAEREQKAIKQQLNQIRQRFEVGLSAITDLHEAQARYDLSTAQLVSAQSTLSSAREALREMINREIPPLSRLTATDLPLTLPKPEGVEEWVKLALDQSPLLKLQRAQVAVAQLAIEQARSSYYPGVDLVGRVSRNDNSNSKASDTTSQSIGIQLNWTLYNGGYTSSRMEELRLKLQQAEAQLEQQQRATVKTTRSAYLAVSTGIELVKARKQVISSAQTALSATETGLNVGTRTTVDLLNAQKDLFSAQRDSSKARYELILALLSLKQSAGTLQPSDLAEINQLLK